uniref:Major capsid protein L1 n=2 Tax=Human papillomavirus TaxID=10566 RepID=A0A385PLM4_9PAPI|nr:MAG: L1 protein [Human papillomavirus]
MASLWLPSAGPLYLPPAKPTARVLRTDEYVKGTDVYFYASSDRLLIVGHPHFDVIENGNKISVPKVSANQYRVFHCKLPDPNKFALVNPTIYNPERERLVWRLTGVEIGRGGGIGVSSVGHPLFNKIRDTENPNQYPAAEVAEQRMDVSMDPKQIQMFILGCVPATGEYWDTAPKCTPGQRGDCPAIQLVNDTIQDGDMGDIGFGALNFKALQQDRSGVTLDLVNTYSIYPDFLRMTKDTYGDGLFFYGKKEQMFARHLWARAGIMGDSLPEENYLHPPDDVMQRTNLGSHVYVNTPSGSLVTNDSSLFNRPYWLRQAQGANNGICWENNLFITVLDNSRGTNFTISVLAEDKPLDTSYKYTAKDFKQYSRHVEEYELEFVFQLCKVTLDADVLAHINVMNPRILDGWQLSFVPPPQTGIEDAYRYIKSDATRCHLTENQDTNTDPYKDKTFWLVDLSEKFSSDLSQYSLGRKFLNQVGLLNGRKRLRPDYTVNSVSATKKTVKRKRTK